MTRPGPRTSLLKEVDRAVELWSSIKTNKGGLEKA